MLDVANDLARAAVSFVTSLLRSVRREIDAWIHGGDTSFIVVLVALAVIMLVLVLVPRRGRY